MFVELSDDSDNFRWKLHVSGVLLVKSMYHYMMNGIYIFVSLFEYLKVPLKIKDLLVVPWGDSNQE